MCGIAGIFGFNNLSQEEKVKIMQDMINSLQHRGQESAGSVSTLYDEEKNKQVMPSYKGFGLVLSVFDKPKIFKKVFVMVFHQRFFTL